VPAGQVRARAHEPAVAASFETERRALDEKLRAGAYHCMGEPARQRQRVDMAPGAIPETAVPGVGTEHAAGLLATEKLHRRASLAPLPDASLGDGDAPRAVCRLHPAGLLGLGLDTVLPHRVEQDARAIAQQRHETLAGLAVTGLDVIRVGTRQGRDHLSVVAARGAPAGLGRLDDRNLDACLAQVERGGQSGETGADDDRIDLDTGIEHRTDRPGRGSGSPDRAMVGSGAPGGGIGHCMNPGGHVDAECVRLYALQANCRALPKPLWPESSRMLGCSRNPENR
jgi:hypothetical protein